MQNTYFAKVTEDILPPVAKTYVGNKFILTHHFFSCPFYIFWIISIIFGILHFSVNTLASFIFQLTL